MNFFAAIKSAEFFKKLAAVAGFDVESASKVANENALKDFVAGEAAKAAKPDAELTEQVKTLNASLVEAVEENEKLKALSQDVGALGLSLDAAGIKLPKHASDATVAQKVAANKAAIEAHVKIAAGDALAKTGHQPIEDEKKQEAKTVADSPADRVRASFKKQVATLTGNF